MVMNTYLPAAPAVVLPADDGERGLAGDAGVAGLVWDPVWRVCGGRGADFTTGAQESYSGYKEGEQLSLCVWPGCVPEFYVRVCFACLCACLCVCVGLNC